ncbi:autotransporter domain-containing protein [Oceanicola sp. 22II-s10i]|uniref:autotransporter domain-containing protein n=1 Tax=Oceanicola sp. 22II-s10i TaxID=1317116 RepID=UPI001130D604|nr:autotransporter domain-containing protein [Oceanicola sp. 22II-s10i]
MAQEIWTGAVSSDLTVDGNWQDGSTPVPPPGGTTFTVGNSTDAIGNMPVVTTGQSFVSRGLSMGGRQDATLDIRSGGTLQLGFAGASGRLIVGDNAGPLGTGQTARVNVEGLLDISQGGTGGTVTVGNLAGAQAEIDIRNGGAMTAGSLCVACGDGPFAGTGTVTISGAGSRLDTLGNAGLRVSGATTTSGTGTLRILDGAEFQAAAASGSTLGHNGRIEARGAGSLFDLNSALNLTGGDLTVADGARANIQFLNISNAGASIAVENGGVLASTTASSWQIGQDVSLRVAGAGSELLVQGSLSINSSNIGAPVADVVIENGGRVVSSSAQDSGLGFGEARRVLVRTGGELSLGGGLVMNTGALEVEGGTATINGALTMGSFFSGNSLTLIDSDFTATRIITGGGTGPANVINLGGTAGGPAGALGTFAVDEVRLNPSGGGVPGEMILNHTETDYRLSATIGGSQGVIRHIAGDTIYDAPFNPAILPVFRGELAITGGTFTVDSTFGESAALTTATVANGGTLAGAGSLNARTVVTDGRLAPGSDGTGTLSLFGDLFLAARAQLDYQLGAPGGVAGVDSDLINIGTGFSLTLDGTLNLADAGGFGPGLYRLMNFTGPLTDNGLDLGTLPAGFSASDMAVQTSVANQVNLLVNAPPPPPATAGFLWDGINTTANNVVDGGSGTWTATGTNWTILNGTANGAYDDRQLLIFAAPGGAVTLDLGTGALTVDAGLQFAADGYVLAGADLAITDDMVLRIGDGTAAGAGIVTTFANGFTGAFDIEKTDLGTAVFNGTGSGTGALEINAGRVIANGALTNTDTLVLGGGTLGGTGTLAGAVDVRAGGTLGAGDPLVAGNRIGTLTADSATFASGSVLAVELNDGGATAGVNNDILRTRAAIINGGTVQVRAANGTDDGSTYTAGTRYTLVNATAGVTGTFTTLDENFAFLDFALSYDPNNVFLTSVALTTPGGGFCLPGYTFNQCSTGNGVGSLGSGTLFSAVQGLSAAEAPRALDALSGEIHATLSTALTEDSRHLREAALSAARNDEGRRAWVQVYGSDGHIGSDGNAARADTRSAGLTFGLPLVADGQTTMGIFGGYGASELSIGDTRASSSTTKSWHMGVYGRHSWGALSLSGGASQSWHSIDVTRTAAFTGFSDRLTSSMNGRTTQVFAETAWRMEGKDGYVEPFAGLAYVRTAIDGSGESGGAAALTVAGSRHDQLYSTLGLRGGTSFGSGTGRVTVDGGIGWRHAFLDVTPETSHSFAGGSAFAIRGAPAARDALVIHAGVSGKLSAKTDFNIGYSGAIASGSAEHKLSGMLKVSF